MAFMVDLSLESSQGLPGLEDKAVALDEVLEDLRVLQAKVRKLPMTCAFLADLPEWLGELVHLEVLILHTAVLPNPRPLDCVPMCVSLSLFHLNPYEEG